MQEAIIALLVVIGLAFTIAVGQGVLGIIRRRRIQSQVESEVVDLSETAEPTHVEEEVVLTNSATPIDYSSFKAVDLKSIAKERKIKGYTSMKKAELVEALQAADEK